MNRAFVKEPDGDQVIDELPDRVHSQHVNYVILAGLPEDEVHFGAMVDVETPEGRRMTSAVVGEDEADAAQGRISWVSPLPRALAEAQVGDAVVYKRPAGEAELTIGRHPIADDHPCNGWPAFSAAETTGDTLPKTAPFLC
jgi:hypothetical protein